MSRLFRHLALLGAAAAAWGQASGPQEVLQAERAFAQQADAQGIRVAFLAWLTPEAKVFGPRMTTAREQYGAEPGDPGHLVWVPEAMGLAASGDLAWSLGPWTYAPRKGATPTAQGHFLSLWRRQPGGGWKVEADIGVPHAVLGALPMPDTPRLVTSVAQWAPGNAQEALADLRRQEAALAKAWQTGGGVALLDRLAPEGQVLRPGHPPLGPGADLRRTLALDPPAFWEGSDWHLSSSHDLAWTCGETQVDVQGRRASYLRVWRRGPEGWNVRFDVRLPHPAPSKPRP